MDASDERPSDGIPAITRSGRIGRVTTGERRLQVAPDERAGDDHQRAGDDDQQLR